EFVSEDASLGSLEVFLQRSEFSRFDKLVKVESEEGNGIVCGSELAKNSAINRSGFLSQKELILAEDRLELDKIISEQLIDLVILEDSNGSLGAFAHLKGEGLSSEEIDYRKKEGGDFVCRHNSHDLIENGSFGQKKYADNFMVFTPAPQIVV
ncbi:hypothetical protein PENTCL1PPCAC_16962, partial [Pristionchus entomophagus]